jgi:hypothetical protein
MYCTGKETCAPLLGVCTDTSADATVASATKNANRKHFDMGTPQLNLFGLQEARILHVGDSTEDAGKAQ